MWNALQRSYRNGKIMSKSTDKLADALFQKTRMDFREDQAAVYLDELRTLAREAAKQTLNDAADAYDEWADHEWEAPHAGQFLRARAEQIGD
jgi:hypothetical protein